jgi:hypothetical protein
MITHLRRNVVAYLALFAAVGGTSYAAVRLPRGSVGRAQLRKNAVTSVKVRDRSLLAKDFKKGQLTPGPRGPAGPQGAAGSPGADGAPGQTGPQGPAGPGAIKLLAVPKAADGATARLATVAGFDITDTCSVTQQGGATNDLEFKSTVPTASVHYRFAGSTDAGPVSTSIGSGTTSFGVNPTAPPGAHQQEVWLDVALTDGTHVATVSVYVRAVGVGEVCRVVGSALPAG